MCGTCIITVVDCRNHCRKGSLKHLDRGQLAMALPGWLE
uniref:Uncharacterized protein n=1 Tax=Rhizophora mucronata TaxID=61149 RepID=A0A2P2R489_RHIMU